MSVRALVVLALSAASCSATTTPPDSGSPPPDAGMKDGGEGSHDAGFVTPNILDNASFETGWSGFTNWTGVGDPTGDHLSRSTQCAHTGTYGLLRVWTPNPSAEDGTQLLFNYGATDRVWMRFYLKGMVHITTVMKFARFYNETFSTALGGFMMGEGDKIFAFGTDIENGAITTWFGLTEAEIMNDQWHSLEVDYWRNGDPSGFPSAAFWFDGHPISMPDGNDVHYFGAGNSMYWSGGRLYSAERSYSGKLGYIEWLATLNTGNTTTGQICVDDISISTVGRIGP